MSELAIKVENLSKEYLIGKPRSGSLRESLSHLFQPKSIGGSFWALKDVSFEVNRGESIGIIGRNGAGKSTLLKIMSSITKPTSGQVTLFGRVSSLLEVGTGFHPELTGRENVFLNGAILGMTRKEIKFKFDEIVEFSGVEKFLDTPLKHYSSGMKVRLAFSVAAHLEPEILIVDEVLAVGDMEFQRKCLSKMEDVASAGRTIFFVSHNMDAVSRLCNRVICLDKGQLIRDSFNVNEIINDYLNLFEKSEGGCSLDINAFSNEVFEGETFTLTGDQGESLLSRISTDQDIVVTISGKLLKPEPLLNIGYVLYGSDGKAIFWSWFSDSFKLSERIDTGEVFALGSKIPKGFLSGGTFRIELIAVIHGVKHLIKPSEGPRITFEVIGENHVTLVNPNFGWFLKSR